jgi:ABC-type spermidine/putrescine transport system permease subunit I
MSALISMKETLRIPGMISSLVMIAPALLLVGILFLFPIALLAYRSFGGPEFSLQHYESLFSSNIYVNSLLVTLQISAYVVLGCLFFGFPIGYVLANAPNRLRPLLVLAVLLPFWSSILVRNFAWIYLLQRRGPINEFLISTGIVDHPVPFMFNQFGVVLGMTNALLPFMVLPIFVALQAQDKTYLEAAASLGAKPETSFRTVTLPLSMPGVMAGSLLVFAMALGFFVTPALLGGGKVLVAATYITNEIETLLNWDIAGAASVVLLAVVVLVVAAYLRVISGTHTTGAGDATA